MLAGVKARRAAATLTGSGLDPGSAQASQAATAGRRDGRQPWRCPMIVDTEASMRFLRTAYEPDDWIAVFLKSYDDRPDAAARRPAVAVPRTQGARVAAGDECQAVQRLRQRQCHHARRQRTRTKDAIAAVRHIFLEADEDGPERLADDCRRARTCRRRRTSWNRRRAGCTSSGASPASRQKAPNGCRSTSRASSGPIPRRRPARRRRVSPATGTTSGRRRT